MFCVSPEQSIPVHSLDSEDLEAWAASAEAGERAWVEASGFEAKPGSFLLVPDGGGGIGRVLAGREPGDRLWALAHLPGELPAGDYRLENDWPEAQRERAAIGWGLGCYRFGRYKTMDAAAARLALAADDEHRIRTLVESENFVRDLVNTPAIDLGPAELAQSARDLAREHGAEFKVFEGEELEREFPAIHVVGQAASRGPRLIRMQWGRADAP
ncbi:MAG TPA: leucyl aminopeptidase family protein, partial [Wenzhouxiangella sp.]|nr:leucyl aminopeptidase family protein [Wenzhouxiangella sp.]